MQLTISIVTKDRKDELKKLLNSILLQEIEYNLIEIIIVDNNSNYDIKKTLDKVFNKSNIKYKLYIFNENKGAVGGRNYSFLKANGKYVLFLDDDVIIEDKLFIKKIIKVMDLNKDIGLLQTGIYNFNENIYQEPVYNKNNKPLYQAFNFIGASHVIRKNIFKNDELLYHKNIFYRNEETFLSLKIIDMGYRVVYYPIIEIIHKPSINRINEDKIYFFNFVNGFVIKKIMYPFEYMPMIYLVIILRFLKNYGIDYSKLKQFLKLYKKRSSKYFKIKRNTAVKLIKNFGFLNFISW